MDASLQNVGSTTTTTTSELPKLISTNSFELNAGTSLSDDSGFAPANSSRFENGSDAEELSQFDSSDSGLSAENFNTLKKIPTTIYDPPPEFQDNYKYPQTTVLRSSSYIQSYAQRLTQNIISKAITSLAHTRRNPVYCLKHSKSKKSLHQKTSGQEHFARKKFMNNNNFNIYGSDSFLNSYNKMNNSLSNNANSNSNINRVDPDYEIYDEPNTEYDVIYKDNKNTVLCTKRIVRSLEKKGESRGSHLYSNTDDLHCNNIKSNSCHNNQNHNLSNNIQSNSFQKKFDKFLRSKFLTTNLTPTTTTSSILYSYCHAAGTNLSSGNPNSRNSLNSRLSSSHNSLTVTTANKADDSIFITQAMSHDALQLGHHIEISDFYNVPIDSDIYTLPIDVINQPHLSTDDKEQLQHQQQQQKSRAMSDNNLLNSSNRSHKIHRSKNKRSKRKKRTENVHKELNSNLDGQSTHQTTSKSKIYRNAKSKRFSVPENSHTSMNLSLDEVKKYYNNLYSTSSESVSDVVNFSTRKSSSSNLKHVTSTQTFGANKKSGVANKTKSKKVISTKSGAIAKEDVSGSKNGHTMKEQNDTTETLSPRFIKGDTNNNNNSNSKYGSNSNVKKSQFSISLNLKQKFCSIFRFKKSQHTTSCIASSNVPPTPPAAQAIPPTNEPDQLVNNSSNSVDKKVKLSTRALPPLPAGLYDREDVIEPNEASNSPIMDKKRENTMDFAANIEKVREYGWYWGPLSSDGAEKILSNEPDGSFIVRDSSDLNYIFSLTFKLNGCVRHVRIEQDQGTFSFGSCALFKSRTIMEFIENAVENSRSGRYLFFLHRRPEHGPMRVQLTNPVSRFKHIQSLQHMCRFVILKAVMRKDLIETLPLPRRILDYLSNKNFLSEQIESDSSQSQVYSENSNHSESNTITRM
ncbi:unnamed protein product [Diamesa tonsa]